MSRLLESKKVGAKLRPELCPKLFTHQLADSRACTPPRSHSLPTSMAALQSIPRFLLPRGPLLLRPQLRLAQPGFHARYASAPSKGLTEEFRRRQEAMLKQRQKAPPVIPQPDKYRPPSHSARKPNRNLENKIYGPRLTEEDKKRMATKKYPNMMSPQGTFSYWFFHNKAIHLWITLVRRRPSLCFFAPSAFSVHPASVLANHDDLGHTFLSGNCGVVDGFHAQDHLCRPRTFAQRICSPPH